MKNMNDVHALRMETMEAIIKAISNFGNVEECWEWTELTMNGYPIVWDRVKQRQVPVRRYLYEVQQVMEIPKGRRLRKRKELCKNKLCVNPHHHYLP